MNLVSELDLPEFDYSAADFSADRYHQQLAETRQRGWLAKSPLAYIVLYHDAGEFFLRSRKTAFPGRQIAEFFGVTSGPLAEHIDAGAKHIVLVPYNYALDQVEALASDVLPSEDDYAKDMGVWHVASTFPQVIAVPIAGFLLSSRQNPALRAI